MKKAAVERPFSFSLSDGDDGVTYDGCDVTYDVTYGVTYGVTYDVTCGGYGVPYDVTYDACG